MKHPSEDGGRPVLMRLFVLRVPLLFTYDQPAFLALTHLSLPPEQRLAPPNTYIAHSHTHSHRLREERRHRRREDGALIHAVREGVRKREGRTLPPPPANAHSSSRNTPLLQAATRASRRTLTSLFLSLTHTHTHQIDHEKPPTPTRLTPPHTRCGEHNASGQQNGVLMNKKESGLTWLLGGVTGIDRRSENDGLTAAAGRSLLPLLRSHHRSCVCVCVWCVSPAFGWLPRPLRW